ncbi:hypothetical protein G6F46_004158 [Rhizopus delemar]|uniref:Uncharacterized protein n=2 Tax=Rhizopus TaxID=4842 RepID=A0A9P6Z3T4_9FUNG|nr:hypothetical protein G6F43_006935 [Rhizopus delemar]KAG1547341.1 hypothetical protein G6F51_004324 [Rhizopus arrhizus]KAG1450187.1 hypothetical protein G6F55_009805 [Rhizopus delemar]KAG1494169.1 hypothetical protein G6F54_008066 [Rhizopus delemar]KAG1506233.1 hypothetical protein G6F53_009840 [Rhizopus delemar]
MSDNVYSMTSDLVTPLYDLQEVIQHYRSQPELLKLILTSKVEEDKRRAEEAKLRAKELDLLLQQQTSNKRKSFGSDHEESIEKRRHSAAAAMLAMGGGAIIPNDTIHPIQRTSISSSEEEQDISSAYPSPVAEEEEY